MLVFEGVCFFRVGAVEGYENESAMFLSMKSWVNFGLLKTQIERNTQDPGTFEENLLVDVFLHDVCLKKWITFDIISIFLSIRIILNINR